MENEKIKDFVKQMKTDCGITFYIPELEQVNTTIKVFREKPDSDSDWRIVVESKNTGDEYSVQECANGKSPLNHGMDRYMKLLHGAISIYDGEAMAKRNMDHRSCGDGNSQLEQYNVSSSSVDTVLNALAKYLVESKNAQKVHDFRAMVGEPTSPLEYARHQAVVSFLEKNAPNIAAINRQAHETGVSPDFDGIATALLTAIDKAKSQSSGR